MAEKRYVSVRTHFTADGKMLPDAICWDDGREFVIDRVLAVTPGAARKCGGQGDRYTIRLQGVERYLYFERSTCLQGHHLGQWFVEI